MGVNYTYITPDREIEHKNRLGFTDVCQYSDNMPMERNEIGAIVIYRGPSRLAHGLWLHAVDVLERIIVVPDYGVEP